MAYATIEEARAFGITEEMADDATLLGLLALWSQVIDRACRQWFEPRAMDLRFDGHDTDELHLNVPIVEVTSLYINGSTTALDPSYYVVYDNKTEWPDDRRNPRVGLTGGTGSSIFSARGSDLFVRGKKNQRVVGRFGFVEADLSTPLPIKRALLKLTKLKIQEDKPTEEGGGNQIVGPLTREITDDHTQEFGALQIKGSKGSTIGGITDDPEINRIILLYRAPLSMAVPG